MPHLLAEVGPRRPPLRDRRRGPPLGVVAVSAYLLVAATGFAPAGLSFLVEGSGIERGMGFVLVALAVLFIVVAVGNYRGRTWAWAWVVALAAGHAGVLVVGVVQGNVTLLPGVLAAALYGWYYTRTTTRRWFTPTH